MSHPFLLGLLFYLCAFGITMVTIMLFFSVVTRITRYRDIELLRQNNSAVAVVLAAAFIALAIMLKSAIYPVTAQLQDLWFQSGKSASDLLLFILRVCGYLTLSILVSLASLCLALVAFQKFTRGIDEEEEIRKGNTAVAIVLGGVLIAVALMMETGVSDIVNTMIPVKEIFH